jgi:RNA polymerase sigma factor (sigma-70 family)
MISSIPITDRELLSAFVKSADGPAFAALTERHLGLVFGVACRRTGSREMAQEAAQNTFCRLARKAPQLSVGSSLGPWLHAVALREAGTLQRAEAARQRAMQRLAVSAGPLETGGLSAPPPPGSEHLDEALAALPEAARRVLVLRYLQGMSLREVAIEEDTSEEAVRKRVTRALDRLTRLLARRGVTAAGVTACLAAAPVLWPAPSSAATFAARAIKQAAAPAAGAGLSGVTGFALSQWPVVAVFLLTAIPVAWPWGAGESPMTKAGPSGSFAEAGRSKEGQVGREVPTAPGELGLVSVLAQEMRAFASSQRTERDIRFQVGRTEYRNAFEEFSGDVTRLAATRRAVLDFSREEVREVLRAGEGQPWGEILEEALYARWAELMPAEAREAALQKKSPKSLAGVLRAQAATDLPGALRWAVAHAADQCQPLLEPLLRSHPKEYLRLMESMMPKGTGLNRNQQYLAVFPHAPDVALEGWRESEKKGELKKEDFVIESQDSFKDLLASYRMKPELAGSLAAFAEGLPENSLLRSNCLFVASKMQFEEAPERAVNWLALSRMAGGDGYWLLDMEAVLLKWKDKHPEAPAGWLGRRSDLDPDTKKRLAGMSGLTLPSMEAANPINTP